MKRLIIFAIVLMSIASKAQTDSEYYFKDNAGNYFTELDLQNLGISIRDIDPAGRMGVNTVFGDRVSAVRLSSIASQFQYGIREGDSQGEFLNGGSYSIENSLLKIRTGAASNGSAMIQSTETVRYVPGQEVYCFFTAVFDTAVENSYQRLGLFDGSNGFFVGYEGTQFSFTRRRDSVDYTQEIDLKQFQRDYGYKFIPQRGNIYKISYGYLGFATINLEVLKPQGGFVLLAQIEYPNIYTVTHTTQTFLPVRGEVGNSGNTTNLEVVSGSLAAGVINGGGEDIAGREFTWVSDVNTVSDSATIVVFRNKSTFYGIENKVPARLLLISGANVGNKTVRWRILKNPNLKASPVPVWTDVDTNNSTLEYSTNAVVSYYNSLEYFLAWNTGSIADFFEFVEGLKLDLYPNGSAAFVVYTTASGMDVDLSIRWSELF